MIALPVHIHERIGKQWRARSRLSQQLGRAPSTQELAADLGWRPQQVAQLDAVSQATRSLNANHRTPPGRHT